VSLCQPPGESDEGVDPRWPRALTVRKATASRLVRVGYECERYDSRAHRRTTARTPDRVAVVTTRRSRNDPRIPTVSKYLKTGQMTHEMATRKRWTFGKRSEQLTSFYSAAFSMRRSVRISRRSRSSSRRSRRRLRIGSEVRRSASPCRGSYRASRSAMNLTPRSVAAAARCGASARMSARNSITCPG
jgi:hypothetical protein